MRPARDMTQRNVLALGLIVSLATGCASSPRASADSDALSPRAMRLEDAADQYFTTGNFRIRYREAGSGDPVVFLHGRTNTLEAWTWIADSLATSHRVIAFDERGHGLSTRSGDPRH